MVTPESDITTRSYKILASQIWTLWGALAPLFDPLAKKCPELKLLV